MTETDTRKRSLIKIPKNVTRRYVISGKMPLERAPDSGYFVTRFKEDAFFLDFKDDNLLFRNGARTEQNLNLPLYFLEEASYKRRRMVETLGLRGAEGKLAIFLQYARLPLIDPREMENLKADLLYRAEASTTKLVQERDPIMRFNTVRLEFCDEPIFKIKMDAEGKRITLSARVPQFNPKPIAIVNKKTVRAQFLEYDDFLCSKVSFYLLTIFQTVPSIQEVEIEMWRMTSQNSTENQIWNIEDEYTERPAPNVKRFSAQMKVAPKPVEAAPQKVKKSKKNRKEIQEKRRIEAITREPQPGDELFDNSLSNRSLILATHVSWQAFLNLENSKSSYTARKALSFFDFHYAPDDEELSFAPVAPLSFS